MSDFASGLHRNTPSIDENLSNINKNISSMNKNFSDLNKSMKDMKGVLKDIFELAGGNTKAGKSLFDNLNKIAQRKSIAEELEATFGKDFKAIVKYVKTKENDEKYQKAQDKINKQAGTERRHLQDKHFFGSLFDVYAKKNPILQVLSGRYQDRPGSAKSRLEESQEALDYSFQGRSDLLNKGYYRHKFGSLTPEENNSDMEKSPIDNFLGQLDHIMGRDKTKGGVPKLGLEDKSDMGGSPIDKFLAQGDHLVGTLKKFGPGRIEVTEGDVAKLPFYISAPSELLHEDLKKIIGDMDREVKLTGENVGLGGGKGGGPLGGLLGGLLGGGLLESLTAALPVILPILAGITAAGGLAYIIYQMVQGQKKGLDKPLTATGIASGTASGGPTPSYIPSIMGPPTTSKPKDTQADHLKVLKVDGLLTTGIRWSDRTRIGAGMPGTGGVDYRNLSSEDQQAIFKTLSPDYQKEYKNLGAFLKNAPYSALARFHTGGVLPKNETLFRGLPGEVVLSPYESQGFKKDIQTLVDKASSTPKNENINKNLEQLMERLLTVEDNILKETTKGNELLDKKESPPPPPSNNSRPPVIRKRIA